MNPELGIIEGFYGPLWSWEDRWQLVQALAPSGYGFYLYAPKADACLRRQWTQSFPAEQTQAMARFAEQCRQLGVRFGVGLSPFEVFHDFNAEARTALQRKIGVLEALGVEELAILFDDMRGDLPGLAETQAAILNWAGTCTSVPILSMCPTYYSDDPVLDRVFGPRPPNYLETLGQALDPSIRVFWTGEEVCTREFSPAHLQRVTQQLKRRPVLWDNYPVNDGPRMSNHLHLRAFTGRPAANAAWLAGHAINPALQVWLTRIPALSLSRCYTDPHYQYGKVFREVTQDCLGPALADQLHADLLLLQDTGLQRLGPDTRERLRQTYSEFEHPAAQEILRWLEGDYLVQAEVVATQ